MEKWAVIVAGGSGTRMGGDVPKQFMLLDGKPVLMHTLQKFSGCRIVLVLPAEQIQYWRGLCRAYGCQVEHQVVAGGDTRTDSVLCGLRHVPDDAVVAIHDGVRPLASCQLIERCFSEAQQYGSAIPAIECTDSIRCDGHAVERSRYTLVQTPQTFLAAKIKEAYDFCMITKQADADNSTTAISQTQQTPSPQPFTDDATVFERAGYHLHFTKGERGNIKITLPVDLKIAEALLH